MSIKDIYSDLPPGERLKAALEDILEGIREGFIKAIRDEDGEIRFIHAEHWKGEPEVPIDEVVSSIHLLLYGEGMN